MAANPRLGKVMPHGAAGRFLCLAARTPAVNRDPQAQDTCRGLAQRSLALNLHEATPLGLLEGGPALAIRHGFGAKHEPESPGRAGKLEGRRHRNLVTAPQLPGIHGPAHVEHTVWTAGTKNSLRLRRELWCEAVHQGVFGYRNGACSFAAQELLAFAVATEELALSWQPQLHGLAFRQRRYVTVKAHVLQSKGGATHIGGLHSCLHA
mmetsp:Transcript_19332/g.41080  ORF Transcript_19332/g.41080 Transcript_19332/m.41080 type:complete len:208 (-) Transcript_19332:112-735(-)